MNGEGIDIYSHTVRVGKGSDRRRQLNSDRKRDYEKRGYTIEDGNHPNGAFFAYKGKQKEDHEMEVGRVCAENGLTLILEPEGNTFVRLPSGARIIVSSLDGTIEGVTQEIMALKSERPSGEKVLEGIEHSLKQTKQLPRSYDKQAQVAITVAPIGSKFTKEHIDEGVRLYREKVMNGTEEAKPRFYIHVDLASRKIWYRALA